MRCPQCQQEGSKVIDKRNNRDINAIRRRRECLNCSTRYTTYEKQENTNFLVRKKTGSVEEYDRNKLRNSILKGLKKRHISEDELNKFIDRIELTLLNKRKPILDTTEIGYAVLDNLKDLDEIAYLLYAIVYLELDNLEAIDTHLEKLRN